MMSQEPRFLNMASAYYQSQDTEAKPVALSVIGEIPSWLEGKLIRNGPALFEAGKTGLRHWFDGYGLLHAFGISGGTVSYRSRFIRSKEYLSAKETGGNRWITWGTASDPCRSIFRRFMSTFETPDNTSVAIAKVGGRYFTTSDMTTINEFDIESLDTLSTRQIGGRGTVAAHPAFARDGSVWNMSSSFSPRPVNAIFSFNGEAKAQAARFSLPRTYYFHSFASTERYFVTIEQPLYLSFWKLVTAWYFRRSYYECFSWDSSAKVTLHVYDRQTKLLEHIPTGLSFFYFHTINSFESDGALHMDLCAYKDDAIIRDFYLDALRTRGIPEGHKASLMRLTLDLESKHAVLADLGVQIELPNINHTYGGAAYRYAYGIHSGDGSSQLSDALIKYDCVSAQKSIWKAESVYPGEPIFVATPDASAEDHGVILSVCYEDATSRSFLLVLDASTMQELARAYAPSRIPASLHGAFYRDVSKSS